MTTCARAHTLLDALKAGFINDARDCDCNCDGTRHEPGCRYAPRCEQDIAPHIAKIPLRAEYQAMLQAAELYAEQSIKHQLEANRLRDLSTQAMQQAENLRVMAAL